MEKEDTLFFTLVIDTWTCISEVVDSSMFSMYCMWRDSHPKSMELSEYDQVSQCLLQSMISKGKALQQLFKGSSIGHYTDIIDISSMASIMRNIYETAFIYHNIFINTDNEIERKLLYYLWQLKGFNNLIKLPDVPTEFKNKKADAEKNIRNLREFISNLMTQMNIADNAKEQFDRAINKETTKIGGYILKKDSDCGAIVSLQKISFDKPEYFFDDNRFSNLYNYLSIHSHPTFLGLLAFGQMFDGKSVYEHAKLILIMACICLSKFTSDFCNVVDGGKDLWNKFESQNSTICFYSKF